MIRRFHLDAGCAHTFRCIAHNYGYSASEPDRARARAAACGADSRICVSDARTALRAAVRALALALSGSFKKQWGFVKGAILLCLFAPLTQKTIKQFKIS